MIDCDAASLQFIIFYLYSDSVDVGYFVKWLLQLSDKQSLLVRFQCITIIANSSEYLRHGVPKSAMSKSWGREMVSHRSHKPKIVGSSPTPATI